MSTLKQNYTQHQLSLGRLVERELLTPSDCSEKRTYHIVLETDIPYAPGDCVAIFPDNLTENVERSLAKISALGDERVVDGRTGDELTLREFLTKRANLDRVRAFEGSDPQLFASAHARLLPRFYSIASALPGEIHLLVRQTGLCTDYLCHRVPLGSRSVPLYIQSGAHFGLPEEPAAPMIMIGAGTGVAPYRSFAQARSASEGWLFFGEWTEPGHFFYRDEWQGWRVTTAFSRDQAEKIYLQHRLEEHAAEVWAWLERGAYLYLCGDAKQMAPDVESVLKKIIALHSSEDPKLFLRDLRRSGRYRRDIY